jgi:hypothetical protein
LIWIKKGGMNVDINISIEELLDQQMSKDALASIVLLYIKENDKLKQEKQKLIDYVSRRIEKVNDEEQWIKTDNITQYLMGEKSALEAVLTKLKSN